MWWPRRQRPVPRRKVEWIKNLWIFSGCLMLMSEAMSLILVLCLLTTLCSFMILDEL